MRHLTAFLMTSVCLLASVAAHADTFQYTILYELNPLHTQGEFIPYQGTYTFTLSSEPVGEDTFVYGLIPIPVGEQFSAIAPYLYAADFTVPVGSPVNEISIGFEPANDFYGFALYGPGVTSTSLIASAQDPGLYTADYGQSGYASMQITDLGSSSSTPEPSSLVLLGTGVLAAASRIRRSRILS